MVAALASLAACCVVFGVLPRFFLDSVMAPAAAGAALAWAYLRTREPGPVRLLRAAHTGSVNDYAAYAIAGMLAVIAVLTLT